MTPPKQDGPSCPLPGCNMDDLRGVVKEGFEKIQTIQSHRIAQDSQTQHLLEQNKTQQDINEKLFDKYADLLKQLGSKVDKDMLSNAMQTVQTNISALKSDMKWYNDTLKKDMKWFISYSLGGVTVAITLIFGAITYFAK